MSTFTNTNTTNPAAPSVLPLERRYGPLNFQNTDGTTGCVAYPINYDELYNLKGRLLTIVDATFTDAQQRKAMKDIVWQTLRAWMTDIESAFAPGYSDPADPDDSNA